MLVGSCQWPVRVEPRRVSRGDINEQIVPCEKCNDLIAIGKGHVSRIDEFDPGIKGVWYSHIDVKDCTPHGDLVKSVIGKPYVEVDERGDEREDQQDSNVIQTEFTTLDVMLRRVRDANPSEIVVIYPIDQDGDTTRVSWLGSDRVRLVGMLTGAAMDVWNDPEKTVREIGPGESA